MDHFVLLILEYAMLPIALFVVVFIGKSKAYASGYEHEQILEFAGDGIEIVLIEAFAYLSIGLRFFFVHIAPAEEKNLYANILVPIGCFLAFVYLLYTCVKTWYFEKDFKVKKIQRVEFIMHTCFFSWWFRIFLIAFTISTWTISVRAVLWPIMLIGASCALFYYKFDRILYFLILPAPVLLRRCTSLLNQGRYEEVQKKIWKTMKVIKRTKDNEGASNYADALALLGYAYCHAAKPKSCRFHKALKILEQQLTEQSQIHYPKSDLKNMLACFYCLLDQPDNARNLINSAYSDSPVLRAKKLEIVDKGNYLQLIPI